jgi:hypothetical protein
MSIPEQALVPEIRSGGVPRRMAGCEIMPQIRLNRRTFDARPVHCRRPHRRQRAVSWALTPIEALNSWMVAGSPGVVNAAGECDASSLPEASMLGGSSNADCGIGREHDVGSAQSK